MWFGVILLTTRRCPDYVIQCLLRELAGNTYCNLDLHPGLLVNNFLFVGSSNSCRGQNRKFKPAPRGCLMSSLCLNFPL